MKSRVDCLAYAMADLYTQHEFLIRSSRAGIAEESTDRYAAHCVTGIFCLLDQERLLKKSVSLLYDLIEGPAYCGGDVIGFRPSIDTDATFFGYATDCARCLLPEGVYGTRRDRHAHLQQRTKILAHSPTTPKRATIHR